MKEGIAVLENKTPYRVEGETGRFEFTTHSCSNAEGIVFNTAKSLFSPLCGRERYRTEGFEEIALFECCTERSYRNSQDIVNRIRHQPENGTPLKTLAHYAENEAAKIDRCFLNKTEEILKNNIVDEGGKPLTIPEEENDIIYNADVVKEAIAKIDLEKENLSVKSLLANPMAYENPEKTVNISVDDICVKKQKESRQNINEENSEKRSRVYNTVTHIQYDGKSYVIASRNIMNALRSILAFLFYNNLAKLNFLFFTDGQKSLQNNILSYFSWKNCSLILDWYHLDKKCKELLSMAMKNRTLRNETLAILIRFLWFGLIDDALTFLDSLPPENIKNKAQIDQLKNYFERNRAHIPCYALREIMKLRNSSNIGEKMNDLIVASRQKHNGMSWSEQGSEALALLKCIKQNDETQKWLKQKDISFKLTA